MIIYNQIALFICDSRTHSDPAILTTPTLVYLTGTQQNITNATTTPPQHLCTLQVPNRTSQMPPLHHANTCVSYRYPTEHHKCHHYTTPTLMYLTGTQQNITNATTTPRQHLCILQVPNRTSQMPPLHHANTCVFYRYPTEHHKYHHYTTPTLVYLTGTQQNITNATTTPPQHLCTLQVPNRTSQMPPLHHANTCVLYRYPTEHHKCHHYTTPTLVYFTGTQQNITNTTTTPPQHLCILQVPNRTSQIPPLHHPNTCVLYRYPTEHHKCHHYTTPTLVYLTGTQQNITNTTTTPPQHLCILQVPNRTSQMPPLHHPNTCVFYRYPTEHHKCHHYTTPTLVYFTGTQQNITNTTTTPRQHLCILQVPNRTSQMPPLHHPNTCVFYRYPTEHHKCHHYTTPTLVYFTGTQQNITNATTTPPQHLCILQVPNRTSQIPPLHHPNTCVLYRYPTEHHKYHHYTTPTLVYFTGTQQNITNATTTPPQHLCTLQVPNRTSQIPPLHHPNTCVFYRYPTEHHKCHHYTTPTLVYLTGTQQNITNATTTPRQHLCILQVPNRTSQMPPLHHPNTCVLYRYPTEHHKYHHYTTPTLVYLTGAQQNITNTTTTPPQHLCTLQVPNRTSQIPPLHHPNTCVSYRYPTEHHKYHHYTTPTLVYFTGTQQNITNTTTTPPQHLCTLQVPNRTSQMPPLHHPNTCVSYRYPTEHHKCHHYTTPTLVYLTGTQQNITNTTTTPRQHLCILQVPNRTSQIPPLHHPNTCVSYRYPTEHHKYHHYTTPTLVYFTGTQQNITNTTTTPPQHLCILQVPNRTSQMPPLHHANTCVLYRYPTEHHKCHHYTTPTLVYLTGTQQNITNTTTTPPQHLCTLQVPNRTSQMPPLHHPNTCVLYRYPTEHHKYHHYTTPTLVYLTGTQQNITNATTTPPQHLCILQVPNRTSQMPPLHHANTCVFYRYPTEHHKCHHYTTPTLVYFTGTQQNITNATTTPPQHLCLSYRYPTEHHKCHHYTTPTLVYLTGIQLNITNATTTPPQHLCILQVPNRTSQMPPLHHANTCVSYRYPTEHHKCHHYTTPTLVYFTGTQQNITNTTTTPPQHLCTLQVPNRTSQMPPLHHPNTCVLYRYPTEHHKYHHYTTPTLVYLTGTQQNITNATTTPRTSPSLLHSSWS